MRLEQWPRGDGVAATAGIRDLLDAIRYLPVSQRERDLLRLELRAGGERGRFARSLLSTAAPLRFGTFASQMGRLGRRMDAILARIG